MKKNDYIDKIETFLSTRSPQQIRARKLAKLMGIPEDEYGAFRHAIKVLRESGRLAMGAKNALTLPAPTLRIEGYFSANPKGFGFVVPKEPGTCKDLYIPAEHKGGALTGDLVAAEVIEKPKRRDKAIYSGRIVEILKRGSRRFVGTLERHDTTWFVVPDGKKMNRPIVIADRSKPGLAAGTKVVVDLDEPQADPDVLTGSVSEILGPQGTLSVETLAVVRQYDLQDKFSKRALACARKCAAEFDPKQAAGRQNLTGLTVVTIDPDDAKDFDDAVSLERNSDNTVTLGVHIADVSEFVPVGTALDDEAKQRGTSVYFPRKVLPMLPEALSNGICSLQQDEPRYVKSVFIVYNEQGNALARSMKESIIQSAKRLTYRQAQNIADGKTAGFSRKVVALVKDMDRLARRIEKRRHAKGQIHLDLPVANLVFDDKDRVVDAEAGDSCYSHTMIEMFMVEANEAVAALFRELSFPIIRRIHPPPAVEDYEQLATFLKACGHKLPSIPSAGDLQELIESVQGRPEGYTVNLAVLRTFRQAVYSIEEERHFALAGEDYCHFTSPIRRYPDLSVHRTLTRYLRGDLKAPDTQAVQDLVDLAKHCTQTERAAMAAELDLRQVLILQHLASKPGYVFDGVITGVTDFGIFVQFPRFLIEGLLRLRDLGDDWWDVQARYGMVRGERTGKTYRIGGIVQVRIVGVDVPKRHLDIRLMPEKKEPGEPPNVKRKPKHKQRPKQRRK